MRKDIHQWFALLFILIYLIAKFYLDSTPNPNDDNLPDLVKDEVFNFITTNTT